MIDKAEEFQGASFHRTQEERAAYSVDEADFDSPDTEHRIPNTEH